MPRLRLAPVLLYPAAPQAKCCARLLRRAHYLRQFGGGYCVRLIIPRQFGGAISSAQHPGAAPPPVWRGALCRFTVHGTKTSKTGGSLCDSCSLRDQEQAEVSVLVC